MAALLLLSGFFSGSEAAYFSLSVREKSQLSTTSARDLTVRSLLSDQDRLLTAILLWNLTINIAFFSLSGLVASRLAEYYQWPALNVFVAFGAMTTVIIIGELIPKNFAVILPLPIARLSAAPLLLAVRIAHPLSQVLRVVAEFSRRIIWPGMQPESYIEVDDLHRAIEHSTNETKAVAEESATLQNVVRLGSVHAEEWMRPRGSYRTFEMNTTVADIGGELTDSGYCLLKSRSSRSITHSVRLSDVPFDLNAPLSQHRRPVFVVPWCAPLSKVLEKSQQLNRDVAVVVNEQGEIIGVLTVEDLAEFIFNLESAKISTRHSNVIQTGPEQWEVTGSTSLRRLERAIGLKLPDTSALTVAGIVHDELNRLARPGDICRWNSFEIEVIAVEQRSEMLVRLSVIAAVEKVDS